ncbi:unnamed protein product, partial [Allacma fusca]
GKKLQTAIKKKTQPDKTLWKEYEVKIHRSLDDYDYGLILARKAEDTSDLCSEFEDREFGRRPVKTTRNSDFVYSEVIPEGEEKSCASVGSQPQSNSVDQITEPESSLFLQHLDAIQHSHLEDSINSTADESIVTDESENYITEVLFPTSTTVSSSITSNSEIETLKAEVNGLRAFVAEQLASLKDGMREFSQAQNFPSGSRSVSRFDFEPLMNIIPISSEESLESAFEWLKASANASLLRRYFHKIGDTNVGKVTRSILEKLFTRNFAIRVGYKGGGVHKKFSSNIVPFTILLLNPFDAILPSLKL